VTRSIQSFAVLLAIALGAAGCATTRAQIPEQEPTLVVPPVPPRTIEPPVVVEPPVEVPTVEPAPAPTPTNRTTRPRAQTDTNKPDPNKQEPPPDTVAAVPTPQPVAPLRTATAPSGQEAIRQIREILDATLKMLDKVEKSETPLSDDRKANLVQARALIQQTDEALKKEEVTQARSFAERAQNIAKLLASGR
jgi:hypothetical protein